MFQLFEVFELFIIIVFVYLAANLIRYLLVKTSALAGKGNRFVFGLSNSWLESDEKK